MRTFSRHLVAHLSEENARMILSTFSAHWFEDKEIWTNLPNDMIKYTQIVNGQV